MLLNYVDARMGTLRSLLRCQTGGFWRDSKVTLFTIFFQRHAAHPQMLVSLSNADVRLWRLRKKSAHGSPFLMRSRIVSMLSVEGSRFGRTSGQYKGVDTGARARRRTEYGATTV